LQASLEKEGAGREDGSAREAAWSRFRMDAR
jgi:hypothetical protein